LPERILVAGATGALGKHVLAELKRRGHTIRAVGRRAARLEPLRGLADELIVADALRPATIAGICEGVDRVFSCMGASVIPMPQHGYATFSKVDYPSNLNLLREAERAGVGHFTYVSTFHTPNLKRFDFVRGHERVVDALKQSALNWSVVRPTGYFSAMEEILLVASLGLLPEHAGGIARTNPIHEADLALICVDALFDGIQERDVGGPEPLSRNEIATLAYGTMGKADTARRVPVSVLATAGILIRPISPRVGHLFSFIAEILKQDVVAPRHGTKTIGEFFQERAARNYRIERRGANAVP
jgi:uncharacterized protein YbjT (DUF2867 family)